MRLRLEMDTGAVLARMQGHKARAQAALDAAVLRDCAPYVPRRTGQLVGSGRSEAGAVVYDAPHARRVYYGNGMRFSRAHSPLASAQWFEKAKAAHGAQWVEEARAAFGE